MRFCQSFQIDIRSWVIFLPERHVSLNEPSVDIPVNMKVALICGSLPDTMVVSLPTVTVSCTGHKPISPVQEIPIKALEQSLAGKLFILCFNYSIVIYYLFSGLLICLTIF